MPSNKKYFSGIGSRTTPEFPYRALIHRISMFMVEKGYILRSGATEGADTYFEEPITDLSQKEIYLPWRHFNGHTSPRYGYSKKAEQIAREYHVRGNKWDTFHSPTKALLSRNVHILLGQDLDTPSSMVIYYLAGDGKWAGGTGATIRIAKACNIPIINLYDVIGTARWRRELDFDIFLEHFNKIIGNGN